MLQNIEVIGFMTRFSSCYKDTFYNKCYSVTRQTLTLDVSYMLSFFLAKGYTDNMTVCDNNVFLVPVSLTSVIPVYVELS